MKIAWLLWMLPGCSLLGLSDFDIPRCRSQADCEPVNVSRGIAEDACERWQCDGAPTAEEGVLEPGSCRLRARDDDGDGMSSIECGGEDCDDMRSDVLPGAEELCDAEDNDCDDIVDEGESGGLVAGLPRAGMSVTSSIVGGTLAPVLGGEPRASVNNVEPSTPFGAEWISPLTGEKTMLSSPPASSDGLPSNARDIAFSTYEEGGFFAARTLSGCALYVGRVDDTGSLVSGVTRASSPLSSIGAACVASEDAAHSRGTIAITPSRGDGEDPEALLTYLETESQPLDCHEQPVPVMALDLVLFPPGEVHASGDGAPLELGSTHGTAHPGVLALADGRYVVAFSDAMGDLSFVVVSRPAPNASGFSIATAGTLQIDTSSDPIDDIVLAEGRTSDGIEIGVAYREGCGPATSVFFARVVLEGSDLAIDVPPVELGRGVQPVIAHVAEGILRGDDGGGFFVAYDDRGPKVHRIPDRIPAPFDPIADGDNTIHDVLLFAADDRVALSALSAGTLTTTFLSCE